MPAWLISVLKWLATTVLVPMIQKWVEQWHKSKQRATRLKERLQRNEKALKKYEETKSDDDFGNLG